jgi:neutral ceramidase
VSTVTLASATLSLISNSNRSANVCIAGAASVDITPPIPVFLYGYPHVPRTSSGIHDPLFATALYLHDGARQVLLVSVDIIWLSKFQVARVRSRIAVATGVLPNHIMISATHTHSGPSTVSVLSNSHDPAVPPPDELVIELVEEGIVAAAMQARHKAVPAEIGFAETEVQGIGGNRHDAAGPAMPVVPILAIRTAGSETQLLAILYVFSIHPTVLHEDSTLISGDFPGAARQTILRRCELAHSDVHVLHHLGAAGDQSPRNVTRSNTFEEVERLGELLGTAVCDAISQIEFSHKWSLDCKTATVEFPLRKLPTLSEARTNLAAAQVRYAALRADAAPRAAARTAECDCFGAEEINALVSAAAEGQLVSVARECMPAEIQLIRLGSTWLVAWPGEVFVEFATRVHQQFPRAWVVTLANGELQGYLTTAEAVENHWYEASNAIFASPASGNILVETTVGLLRQVY